MHARLPVSVFIIARNEADRIGRTIASVVDLVEEVIVVDSGSDDGTRAAAEAAGARVHDNAFAGYGPQKRFGEDRCRNDWVLNIDADEDVTPALAAELRALVESGGHDAAPCWRVAIRDVFAHEDQPAPWAHDVRQIRFYDRRVARFSESPVFDTVRPPPGAKIKDLRQPLAHRSVRSLSFQIDKHNRYTDMLVADLGARGRRLPRLRLLTEFPAAFLKAYVLRRYALYGWWGFVASMTYAQFRFLRNAKAFEAELMAAAAARRGEHGELVPGASDEPEGSGPAAGSGGQGPLGA